MRIVRASPGWYQHDDVGYGKYPPFERISEGTISGSQPCVWSSGDGWLEIYFDPDGKVERKYLNYSPRFEPSHPERWPWWKRCLNRQIPEPSLRHRNYIQF